MRPRTILWATAAGVAVLWAALALLGTILGSMALTDGDRHTIAVVLSLVGAGLTTLMVGAGLVGYVLAKH